VQARIEKKSGKIINGNDKLREYFGSLEDGVYIVSIEKVNPLTTSRDYQKAYFDKIDICVRCTGNSRYVIHEEFKKFSGTDSTKDLDISAWRKLLDRLAWWAYDNFDCIV
jgi:hypothetical protein